MLSFSECCLCASLAIKTILLADWQDAQINTTLYRVFTAALHQMTGSNVDQSLKRRCQATEVRWVSHCHRKKWHRTKTVYQVGGRETWQERGKGDGKFDLRRRLSATITLADTTGHLTLWCKVVVLVKSKKSVLVINCCTFIWRFHLILWIYVMTCKLFSIKNVFLTNRRTSPRMKLRSVGPPLFFFVLKYRTTQHQDTWNYIYSIHKCSRGEQPNLAPPTY